MNTWTVSVSSMSCIHTSAAGHVREAQSWQKELWDTVHQFGPLRGFIHRVLWLNAGMACFAIQGQTLHTANSIIWRRGWAACCFLYLHFVICFVLASVIFVNGNGNKNIR